MKRRHFLRQAASLPLLGGAVAAGAAVTQESPIKAQIEHHVQALRDLVAQTGRDEVAITINQHGWGASTHGNRSILNPHNLVWTD